MPSLFHHHPPSTTCKTTCPPASKAWSSSPARATGSASLWTTAPPTKAARCATPSPPSCPGLKVIHRENGGLAAARNTGLKAATGDWLLFLDSDDAMAPGLLAQLRGALAAHPDCDWFIGKHLEWQPDGTLTPHDGLHLVPGPFASARRLRRAAEGPSTPPGTGRSGNTASGGRFFGAGPRPASCRTASGPRLALLTLSCCCTATGSTFWTRFSPTTASDGRGSLLTDAKNLPKRFRGLAAAQRRLARLSANGRRTPRPTPPCEDAAADVSGRRPARQRSGTPPSARPACPYIEQLRRSAPHGTEVRTRRDWRLFRWMMQTFRAEIYPVGGEPPSKASHRGKLRLSKKGVLTPWPLCEGAPPAGGGGEELYGCPKYFGLWQGSLPPPPQGHLPAEEVFSTTLGFPRGLRPQARVEA